MWSKIYVGIIVLIVLTLLHTINLLLHYVNDAYNLEANYGVPMNCVSIALCGMNGNIFLLFLIYMIIPDNYYEKALEMLDPRKIHQYASHDVLGINQATANIQKVFL